MTNRISSIERLNLNYRSMLGGRPPLRQSVLAEEVRVGTPVLIPPGGLGQSASLIPRGSRVQTVHIQQAMPTVIVQPVTTVSTLPAISIVETGNFPTTSIQTNHIAVPSLQTGANTPATVVQEEYIEEQEIVESRRTWPRMPKLLASSSRVAPPYQ